LRRFVILLKLIPKDLKLAQDGLFPASARIAAQIPSACFACSNEGRQAVPYGSGLFAHQSEGTGFFDIEVDRCGMFAICMASLNATVAIFRREIPSFFAEEPTAASEEKRSRMLGNFIQRTANLAPSTTIQI